MTDDPAYKDLRATDSATGFVNNDIRGLFIIAYALLKGLTAIASAIREHRKPWGG